PGPHLQPQGAGVHGLGAGRLLPPRGGVPDRVREPARRVHRGGRPRAGSRHRPGEDRGEGARRRLSHRPVMLGIMPRPRSPRTGLGVFRRGFSRGIRAFTRAFSLRTLPGRRRSFPALSVATILFFVPIVYVRAVGDPYVYSAADVPVEPV